MSNAERKSAPKKAESRYEIPAKWTARGYTTVPHSYFERAFRAFDGIAAGVLGLLMRHTVGERRTAEWEWYQITQLQFAKLLNCHENGVARAIQTLEEAGVIESRKRGRNNEYRVLPENLDTLSTKPQRKLQLVPPTSPASAGDDGEGEEEKGSASFGASSPLSAFEAARAAAGAKPVALVLMPGERQVKPLGHVCPSGVDCPIGRQARAAASQLVNIDNAAVANKEVISEKPHSSVAFAASSDDETMAFVEAVEEILIPVLHEPPPKGMLSAQYARLAEADVAASVALGKIRSAATRTKSWALVPKLIDDVLAAYTKRTEKQAQSEQTALAAAVIAAAKALPPRQVFAKAREAMVEASEAYRQSGDRAELERTLDEIDARLAGELQDALTKADYSRLHKEAEEDAADMGNSGGNDRERWYAVILRTKIFALHGMDGVRLFEIESRPR